MRRIDLWRFGLAFQALNGGGQPVQNFVVPAGRYARATTKMSPRDVLRLARRQRRPLIPVEEPGGSRCLLGYLRVVDLALEDRTELPPLRPLVVLQAGETYLSALMRLMAADHALGQVVTESGRTIGFVSAQGLSGALLSGS